MRFYGYFRSSAAYRCRIALNLKGLSPEVVHVHLRKGEQREGDFLKLNPHGLIPMLEVGGHMLTQSLAIIEWLDETYPDPALLPRDAFERAHVRALALSIACDIHPLQNLRVLKHLRTELGQDQEGLDRWCRRWIESGLAAFESSLANAGTSGAFCFKDAPTLADICLMPQLFSAERFGADISAHQHLKRIRASCEAHPAFVAAHPSMQPDAEA
ncbi:MAG: maleylacetoacetate isomerase [Bosea sp. (in: a-proteobacteria)]